MNFRLSDEEKLVLDAAAKFARALREAHRASEKDAPSARLWAAWRELGVSALDWPEAHGGAGLGRLTKLRVLEELAWGDAAATLALDRVSLAVSPLFAVRAVADRAAAAARAGGDGWAPALVVDLDQRLAIQGRRASGTLPYLAASRCDGLFVLQGNRLLYLSRGVELAPVLAGALHAAGASRATVDGEAEWIEELAGDQPAEIATGARLYLAAILVGVARASFDYARQYCLDRVTFGKKVAHHQAVAFTFADMAIAIEAARLVLHQAAALTDTGKDARELRALAFLQASECALFATNYGVQFLGGAGYVRDHPVEKWMREARAISLLYGGPDAAQADANRAIAASIEAA